MILQIMPGYNPSRIKTAAHFVKPGAVIKKAAKMANADQLRQIA
ncbi:hypothetical protein TUM17384_16280 [Shewanella algae]|nr:hypothetical protein TUM17384_16280 [Shewanella algae]